MQHTIHLAHTYSTHATHILSRTHVLTHANIHAGARTAVVEFRTAKEATECFEQVAFSKVTGMIIVWRRYH